MKRRLFYLVWLGGCIGALLAEAPSILSYSGDLVLLVLLGTWVIYNLYMLYVETPAQEER